MKLFDSHAHYNDARFKEEYPGGAEKAIEDSFAAGVVGFLCAGTNPKTSRESIELASQYSLCRAAAGLHPEDAGAYEKNALSGVLDEISALLSHETVSAVGEIGLDYHWDTDRTVQKEIFDAQLSMAQAAGLPVVIHDREAHGDVFDILCAHPGITGVLHSWSGSAEMARDYARRGFYIAFGGTVTFKTAERVREACRAVPPASILTETDCPYLAPVPYRGKINCSAYMLSTLEVMAKTRGEDKETLASATLENAMRLFNISLSSLYRLRLAYQPAKALVCLLPAVV